MKESKFNLYVDTVDGKRLLFNPKTCALAFADEEYDCLLRKVVSNNGQVYSLTEKEKEILNAAREAGFIVDGDTDEVEELSMKRSFAKYSHDALGITIAPTLMCNFACPYCYETRQPGFMSTETQNKLLEFIDGLSSSVSLIDVAWYGGEPLMAKDIVYGLSERLISLCSQKHIEYKSYIITNGSLLTAEDIPKFQKYKIKGAQITIDGPREIHNIRRKSKNGTDTYDAVIGAVNLLLAGGIDVAIRINMDKTNDACLPALLNDLEKRLISNKVHITFGHVTAYTEACKSVEGNCYNNIDYAFKSLQYYKEVKKTSFCECNLPAYPSPRMLYCCAENAYSFVIDQQGYIYKCWNEIGNHRCAIGNINDNINLFNKMHARWLKIDPFEDVRCKDCSILPACIGGCPFERLKNGQPACDITRFNIEGTIKLMYDIYVRKGGESLL